MVITHSLEDFKAFARDFISNLKPNKEIAYIVGLQGDLGSGKTTFTQEVARSLGITETITSPTFVIEKIYKLPESSAFEHLIHIDAYRLEKENELLNLGWQEIISNPKNLILIEWPEKVEGVMPKDATTIYFKFIDENTRQIETQNAKRKIKN